MEFCFLIGVTCLCVIIGELFLNTKATLIAVLQNAKGKINFLNLITHTENSSAMILGTRIHKFISQMSHSVFHVLQVNKTQLR